MYVSICVHSYGLTLVNFFLNKGWIGPWIPQFVLISFSILPLKLKWFREWLWPRSWISWKGNTVKTVAFWTQIVCGNGARPHQKGFDIQWPPSLIYIQKFQQQSNQTWIKFRSTYRLHLINKSGIKWLYHIVNKSCNPIYIHFPVQVEVVIEGFAI